MRRKSRPRPRTCDDDDDDEDEGDALESRHFYLIGDIDLTVTTVVCDADEWAERNDGIQYGLERGPFGGRPSRSREAPIELIRPGFAAGDRAEPVGQLNHASHRRRPLGSPRRMRAGRAACFSSTCSRGAASPGIGSGSRSLKFMPHEQEFFSGARKIFVLPDGHIYA